VTGPLPRPLAASVYVARPMFQVLLDDSQRCACVDFGPGVCISRTESMTVDQDDYSTPNGILL
jgi:hypothetical protein